MKKIQLDTFMDFRMLSSLTFSPDGGKLAYVLTGIDREKKEYVSRLRMRIGDDDRPMVSDGRIGEFFFEDPDHLLFSTDRPSVARCRVRRFVPIGRTSPAAMISPSFSARIIRLPGSSRRFLSTSASSSAV